MKNIVMSALAILLSFSFIACGGSNSSNNNPPPAVSVSLTEASVTMDTSNSDYQITNTHTFTATVRNATNTGVTWKVNGMPGGESVHGTITTAGVYTAPMFIPADAITVSATSVEDSTKSASAPVTLHWYVDNVYVSTNGTAAQVKTGEQVQINAVATTAGPSTVTWDVNGVKVGTPALGALFYNSSWGANTVFYTAPPTSPGSVTIRATSDANPTKSGTIVVTVVNSDPSEPSVAISPAEVTLELGKTQQFTATLTNTSGAAQWERMQGESKLANGLIDATGFYTAPYEMPSTSDVIVSAWTSGYTDKHGYAIVHVAPATVNPNTRVNGSYVIALHDRAYGMDVLGVLIADGNGNIHGTADLNTPFGVATGQAFNGTYSMGNDGRGSATITYTPVAGTTATLSARLMMQSDSLAYLYSSDTYLGMATGVLEKQTASSFSKASLKGSYAFLLRGLAPVSNPTPPPTNNTTSTATAGFLSADGNGNMIGSSDTSTSGVLTNQNISGTYTMQNNGKATATLDVTTSPQPFTSHLSIAMVSPERFYVLSTDDLTATGATAPLLAGRAELQSARPFTNASLSGSYVAYDNSTSWMQLMRFDSDGSGTISNGITDERDTSGTNGPSVSTGVPCSGSYSIDGSGRGQIDVQASNGGGSAYFYMISPGKFFILLNESPAAAGEGYTQAVDAGSFDWSGVDGRYAVELNGFLYDGVGWLLSYYPTSWMGWVDYSANIKTEPSFDFNSTDGYGTGQMFVLFYNGEGLGPMRYYVVSDSKLLMMSMSPAMEGNVAIFLNKLDQ